jgi:ectoine hydroxylase-related dioxygenase (phytanoyl-CoA dioxygenase family)
MSTQVRQITPRQVTAEEIAAFNEQGWVKLDSLISEDDAAILLARLKEKMGEEGLEGEHPVNQGQTVRWRVYAPLSVELETGALRDELFNSLSHSRELGQLGEAFLGTKSRFWVDQALVKPPAGIDGSGETAWHIDIGDKADSPFDPGHQVNVWIALAEVTPEHGAMRFVSPDKATQEVQDLVANALVEESYAELERLGIVSPTLHLRPGDATVHGGSTFHSAPPNRTETPRWAYFVSLFPADTRYSGHPFWPMVGVEGCEVGRRFPDARFPVLD